MTTRNSLSFTSSTGWGTVRSPGDIIIFEDKRFKHGATPLINPAGGQAQRDALVCTVDYPTTYLKAAG
jgi:hypothetical protein